MPTVPSCDRETITCILEIAARLERQASRMQKIAVVDDHQKAGMAQYLKTEALNLRKLLEKTLDTN